MSAIIVAGTDLTGRTALVSAATSGIGSRLPRPGRNGAAVTPAAGEE